MAQRRRIPKDLQGRLSEVLVNYELILEETPRPTKLCVLALFTDGLVHPCGGTVSEHNIHKPFDEHTRIGPGRRAPIDSYASCDQCKTRFDISVLET